MSVPYLKEFYKNTVVPELVKSRGYKNVHEVPAIEKIVINSGINASAEKSHIQEVTSEIALIAGQKPVQTLSRKSISNFKLREGQVVGVKVTLRGQRMYDFLYRLLSVALPTIRDFRGVPSRFDGNGNYTLGVTDHTIFPEISIDGARRGTIGMDITIVTTANSDDEGRELLRLIGMPFRK
jgi:large subunit ribosomal protein L5